MQTTRQAAHHAQRFPRRNALAGDQYSIPLESGCCTICRSSIESRDKLVAVLGNSSLQPVVTDTIFINEIPRYKQDSYVTVPYNADRTSPFTTTRHLEPAGKNYPQTFLFHNDCYKLLARHASKPTIQQIWTAGDWTQPMSRSRLHSPVKSGPGCAYVPFTMPKDLLRFFPETEPLRAVLQRVANLPVELQWMIIERSMDSLLWRYATALTFGETFESLWHAPVTSHGVETGSSRTWVRGRGYGDYDSRTLPFIRLGIDELGIRTVEMIESPAAREISEAASCSWFIIQRRSGMKQVRNSEAENTIEKRGNFLRLDTERQYLLWDTPTRPKLEEIRWNVDEEVMPFLFDHLSRVRNINRLEHLTGLTVFCWGGSIFAIHPHRKEGSSAYDTYQKISWRHREYLTWFYIPLYGRETVDDLWTWPSQTGTFALTTTSGKAYTFGCFRVWVEGLSPEPLNAGPLESIIVEEPQFNKITYFGIHSSLAAPPKPARQYPSQPVVDYRFSPELNCSCYVSTASLENVVRATVFSLDNAFEDWGRGESEEYCHGILFTYANGSQSALGECRYGCAKETTIEHPTSLWFKLVTFSLEQPPQKIAKRMAVRFGNKLNPQPYAPGEGSMEALQMEMKGTLRWWCGEGDGYFVPM